MAISNILYLFCFVLSYTLLVGILGLFSKDIKFPVNYCQTFLQVNQRKANAPEIISQNKFLYGSTEGILSLWYRLPWKEKVVFGTVSVMETIIVWSIATLLSSTTSGKNKFYIEIIG